jgi:hypothetical protein
MAPRKAPKKSEEAAESSSPEGDVVSDTTPHAIDSIKSWRQILKPWTTKSRIFPTILKTNSGT